MNSAKFEQILQIVYFLMFLFIAKQIYNIITTKRNIDSKIISTYAPKSKVLIGAISGMLVVLGIMTIYTKNYFGIIYLLTGLGFIYMFTEKITVYELGIYYNGRFDNWDEIKKWFYNDATKTLELATTKQGNKANRSIPVKPEDKDELLTIIKGKKNRKGKRK